MPEMQVLTEAEIAALGATLTKLLRGLFDSTEDGCSAWGDTRSVNESQRLEGDAVVIRFVRQTVPVERVDALVTVLSLVGAAGCLRCLC